MDDNKQGDLFVGAIDDEDEISVIEAAAINIIAGVYSSSGLNLATLPTDTRRLFEVSADAFDAVVHAWMSELPIAAVIIRYQEKVLAADSANSAGRAAGIAAATDRSDTDARTVLEAAYKVTREIDRVMGLLRFCPDEHGIYIAYCAPDHFILPCLGSYFTERFGETPWAIIDEKRHLRLSCIPGEQWTMEKSSDTETEKPAGGEWEKLWQHYHKTINNESRNNPNLQRQFMPKRYWKYLTELGTNS